MQHSTFVNIEAGSAVLGFLSGSLAVMLRSWRFAPQSAETIQSAADATSQRITKARARWNRIVSMFMHHWAVTGTISVALIYLIAHMFYVDLYSNFGVSPDEVGLGYRGVLTGSATLVLICLFIGLGAAYVYGPAVAASRPFAFQWGPNGDMQGNRAAKIRNLALAFGAALGALLLGSYGIDLLLHALIVGPMPITVNTVVLVGYFLFVFAMLLGGGVLGLFLRIWGKGAVPYRYPVAFGEALDPSLGARPVGQSVGYFAWRLVPVSVAVTVLALLITVPRLGVTQGAAIKEGRSLSVGETRGGVHLFDVLTIPSHVNWTVSAAPQNIDNHHCLLYLGQSGGVFVIYDRNTSETFRLPAALVLLSSSKEGEYRRTCPLHS